MDTLGRPLFAKMSRLLLEMSVYACSWCPIKSRSQLSILNLCQRML